MQCLKFQGLSVKPTPDHNFSRVRKEQTCTFPRITRLRGMRRSIGKEHLRNCFDAGGLDKMLEGLKDLCGLCYSQMPAMELASYSLVRLGWRMVGHIFHSHFLTLKERFDPIDTTRLKPELQTSHRHDPHPAPSLLLLSLLKLPSCHPRYSHNSRPRNRVPPTPRP